jgi:hypothetical protein
MKLLDGYAESPDIRGLVIWGRVDSVAAGNKFTIENLAGLGTGKFMGATNPWWAYVLQEGTGTSAAPQGELEVIVDYDSTTGEFTTNPFTVAVAAGDEILILNPAIANMITESEVRFRMFMSDSGPVEQNAYQMFSIVLFDVDTGGIPSADIDITGISAVLEKSTGGAPFSSAGITQPTFAKADGRVYCSYQFLTAQWAVGDLYRMTVGGINCLVNGEIVYVPTAVWSNVVLTEADISTTVHAIDTSLGAQSDAATLDDLSNITTTSAQAKIRRLLLRIAPAALSAVINGSTDTDLGQMFADLATYFKAAGAAMDPTINALSPTDVSDCFNDLATYFKAAGAAMDPTINGATPTDISDCFNDLATYFKAAGAAYSATIGGAARTDVEASFSAMAAYLKAAGAAFSATIGGAAATDVEAAFTATAALFNAASAAMSVTIDNGGAARSNLNDIFTDLGAILNGAGITTFPAAAPAGDGVNLAAVIRYIENLVAVTSAGRLQEAATTIDLNQIAANYDLFTGTTQVVILESLIIAMPNAIAGGALTSISIQTNDATPQVLIDNIQGAVANLTAENQLTWQGVCRIGVGKKIQLTINGGATGAGYVCNVNVESRAVVSGGYLA